MTGPARVTDLGVIGEFKAVLQTFSEDVKDALVSLNVVNQQILDWIEHDQLKFWQQQIRKAEEAINEAKGDLHRKKLTSTNEFSSHVEERKSIRKAQERAEFAEEKVKACRSWSVKARQVIEEFHSQGQFLANIVDQDLPKAVSFLDAAMRTLEEYVAMQSGGAGDNLASLGGGSTTESTTPSEATPATSAEPNRDAKADAQPADDLPSEPGAPSATQANNPSEALP